MLSDMERLRNVWYDGGGVIIITALAEPKYLYVPMANCSASIRDTPPEDLALFLISTQMKNTTMLQSESRKERELSSTRVTDPNFFNTSGSYPRTRSFKMVE